MQNESAIPLTQAPRKRTVKLLTVLGGKTLTHRLAELGLTPGTKLRVIQDAGGPLIINVRNSKIAIGRGMAEKLMVDVGNE